MSSEISLKPLIETSALRERVYAALKEAITSMDLYTTDEEIRLDERALSENLGVSRTPIRETLARLEQEGFVVNIPRRGAFIARKSRAEIIEMIQVWAGLEGLAARTVASSAGTEQLEDLRKMFVDFTDDNELRGHIDEYSNTNVLFHQKIIEMSGNRLMQDITENLFLHLRSIRDRTIHEKDRVTRSMIDHMHIIEALESRDPDRAQRLSVEHNLGLAEHVRENVHWLK